MPRTSVRLTSFVLTVLAASAAGAAEPGPAQEEKEKSYSWGLGVAALSQQQAYAGIDRENLAVPLIYFENRWIELLGPRLDFKLPDLEFGEDQELSSGLGIELFGFNDYEAKDAPILSGMAERKSGIFAGPFVKWSNPVAEVSAEWLFDASSESKGQQVKIDIERSFHVGERFMLTPSVAAIWFDQKYANYYYGVRSTEARVGRPAYLVDSTVNTEIGLRTDYLINERQTVFLSMEYTALGSKIKDSPLVDRSGETMAFVGYLYRF